MKRIRFPTWHHFRPHLRSPLKTKVKFTVPLQMWVDQDFHVSFFIWILEADQKF